MFLTAFYVYISLLYDELTIIICISVPLFENSFSLSLSKDGLLPFRKQ